MKKFGARAPVVDLRTNGSYGVSVLRIRNSFLIFQTTLASDARLPVRSGYRDEVQDFEIHDMLYAIAGHQGIGGRAAPSGGLRDERAVIHVPGNPSKGVSERSSRSSAPAVQPSQS
jgi:hypothetical protein